MPLYQCKKCGAVENTACANYWWRTNPALHKDDGLPPEVCSECDPEIGKWHGEFPKAVFPIGSIYTDDEGNMRYKDTKKPVQYPKGE
jgi:hypothetical protein